MAKNRNMRLLKHRAFVEAFNPRHSRSHVRLIKSGSAKPEMFRSDDVEPLEPMIDVFSEADCMSVIEQKPYVKKADVYLEILKNMQKSKTVKYFSGFGWWKRNQAQRNEVR